MTKTCDVTLPDTNVLILECKVISITSIVIERPDCIWSWPKEILITTVRGKVGKVTAVLSDFNAPCPGYCCCSNISKCKWERVTSTGSINIHCKYFNLSIWFDSSNLVSLSLQCSPVFVPQIEAGALPLGFVTVKISVLQTEEGPAAWAFAEAAGAPFRILVVVTVAEFGWLKTKVLKSNLNWQMFALARQMLTEHDPDSVPADSK